MTLFLVKVCYKYNLLYQKHARQLIFHVVLGYIYISNQAVLYLHLHIYSQYFNI